MSNRRRPRRLNSWPMPGPDQGYATVPGIVPDRTEPGAIEHARRATHDRLITAWATKRRSGVWWTEHPGQSGRATYTSLCEEAGKAPHAEALAIFEDNPRAVLIVAWAVVDEGEVPTTPAGWIGAQA